MSLFNTRESRWTWYFDIFKFNLDSNHASIPRNKKQIHMIRDSLIKFSSQFWTCLNVYQNVFVSSLSRHWYAGWHYHRVLTSPCLRPGITSRLGSPNCFIWSFNSSYTLQCPVNLGNGQTIYPRPSWDIEY